MKLTEKDVVLARKGYPEKVTEKNVDQAWGAMRTYMERLCFARRNRLAVEDVVVVVNTRTKVAYPQWIGAVPKAMATR